MDSIQVLGLVAGALTSTSMIPQVIKSWKSKSAKDLSLKMFLIFSLGVVLWIVYGLLIGNVPVVATNSLTLALALTLLFFKFKFKD